MFFDNIHHCLQTHSPPTLCLLQWSANAWLRRTMLVIISKYQSYHEIPLLEAFQCFLIAHWQYKTKAFSEEKPGLFLTCLTAYNRYTDLLNTLGNKCWNFLLFNKCSINPSPWESGMWNFSLLLHSSFPALFPRFTCNSSLLQVSYSYHCRQAWNLR